MKTLKELQERGTNYLCGYTDALVDIAHLLIDQQRAGGLLEYLNTYIDTLFDTLLEEEKEDVTK